MKKNIYKIVAVIIIILIIIGIYFFKNKEELIKKEDAGSNKDFHLVITEKLNIEDLKKYNIPIIISFGSEGCMPCLKMQPTLRLLNNKLKGKAIIKYLDVWKNPQYAEGFNFEYIPTQIFIDKNGNAYKPEKVTDIKFDYIQNENKDIIYTTHTGYLSEEDIIKILEEMGM